MDDIPKWPQSLPCPLLEGVTYSSRDNVIRSEMDSGPPKVRRRYTSVAELVSFSMLVDRAQLQVLYDFVSITLGDVSRFLWVEHRDPAGHEALYRFAARPQYEAISYGMWKASLQLELLTRLNGNFPLATDAGTLISDSDGAVLTT